ncbi:MAG: M28 family peptidase [Cyanobacteria bacterium P01_D01_bin.105]
MATKRSSGLFFATAALIMGLVIWGNSVPELMNALLPAPPTPLPTSSIAKSATFDLNVEERRLMAHIEALSQPAALPEQRDAARQYISNQLIQYGLTPVQQPYGTADSGGVNILAHIAGSEPTSGSFILGAHYDTEPNSPGADDNGSGVATVLEAARIFANQAASSASTHAGTLTKSLTLVFFDQEERQPDGNGLLGSRAFTSTASNLDGVNGAIILDMIGYACHTPGCQTYPAQLPLPDVPDTGEFLAVLGLQNHTELMGAFTLSAQRTGPNILTLPIPDPMLRLFPDLLRSDHAPFWEKDIPAVLVSDTANFRNPNYHTPQDTADTLDIPFFKGSAQHVVNAIAGLLS